jgi:cell division septum initiation protein DivIVA
MKEGEVEVLHEEISDLKAQVGVLEETLGLKQQYIEDLEAQGAALKRSILPINGAEGPAEDEAPSDADKEAASEQILKLKERIIVLHDEKKELLQTLEQRERLISMLEDELRNPIPSSGSDTSSDQKLSQLTSRNEELTQLLWEKENELEGKSTEMRTAWAESLRQWTVMFESIDRLTSTLGIDTEKVLHHTSTFHEVGETNPNEDNISADDKNCTFNDDVFTLETLPKRVASAVDAVHECCDAVYLAAGSFSDMAEGMYVLTSVLCMY